MSDAGGSEGFSWNKNSLPVKVVIIVVFVFIFAVNLTVLCHLCLPSLLSNFCCISIPRPRRPTTATTPARAVTATATAIVRVTTTPAVTASSPNVRLSAEVLASLPMFSHSTSSEGDKSNLECSVCLMEFEEGEEGRFLRCLHRFHGECIDMWFHFHSTCPLCRTVVEVEIV